MTDFEKITHLFRFGLSVNRISPNQVIEWADRNIEKGATEDLLFDLALLNSKNEIIDRLSDSIKWSFKCLKIRELILSFYNEHLDNNPKDWKEVEKELIIFFDLQEYDNSNEKSEDFLFVLTDDYQLREEGFTGSLRMPDYLKENLKGYDRINELKRLLKLNKVEGFLLEK